MLEKAYAEMANTLTSVVMGEEVETNVKKLYQPNANVKMFVLFCKNVYRALNASQITGVPFVALTGDPNVTSYTQKGKLTYRQVKQESKPESEPKQIKMSWKPKHVKYAQECYRSQARFIIRLQGKRSKTYS